MSSPISFKLEPASPPSNAEEVTWCSDTDTELYWTTEELLQAVDITSESKSKVVSKLLENLEKLEDLNEIITEDEDAFSSNFWMEEKMLPIYDTALPEAVKVEVKNPTNPNNGCTESLLMEFETVLDAVNNGAFTPPQSPPYQQPILATLESLNPNTIYTIIPNDHTYPTLEKPSIQYMQPSMHQPDVDRELAAVEELVRSRVEIMVPSSPSSSSSNYGDSSSSEDPEWSGEQPTKYNKLSRKRSRPYNHEDKKSRKKEQNKNAATRYRMKKKAEVEEILGEEKVLQDDNNKLEVTISDLQREIKCLKGLMRDLFKAKGLIN